jgi:hypothetical protein
VDNGQWFLASSSIPSATHPRTGKWIRARYRAQRHEIAARYADWEITGPAEIREVDPAARAFTVTEIRT